MAATPNPDARLVVACDRFMALSEERERRWRKGGRAALKFLRELSPEIDTLEAEISQTPARSTVGRLAKAEVAMSVLARAGTIAQTARSALRDFVAVATQEAV